MSDLKFAVRSLLKTPGFTLVAVLTLALGIGATTAMFSVIDAVLVRPLGYSEPDRIVTLWSLNLQRGTRYSVSGPDFADWREQSQSFTSMARYSDGESGVVVQGGAERVIMTGVSDGFFQSISALPKLGRSFSADEHVQGGAAVVSERFAQRHFQTSGGALGAEIKLYGRTHVIIGVMPAAIDYPSRCDVWFPIDTLFPGSTPRSAHNYRVIGRLKPGIEPAVAQAELAGIARRLEQQYPDSNTNKGIELLPLQDYLVRNHSSTLWIMMTAATLLLVIACANVANLLLARGAARARDVAIRAALGAAPWRIVRGLLAESVVLASVAGAVGLFLAAAGIRVLVALAPAGIPRIDTVGLDGVTLLFAVATCLLVCVLAGLAPSLHSARTDVKTTLHAGGRGVAAGSGRLRSAMVVAQVALSLMLLAGAGLLLRSFQLLSAVDPGYRTEQLLVMQTAYPISDEASALQGAAFHAQLLAQASVMPGVISVAATHGLPVDVIRSNGTYFIEGRPDPAPAERSQRNALWRLASPGYFSTVGIPVLAGRGFDERDQAGSPFVVVINESMANAAWPGQDPIGQRLRIGWTQSTFEQGLTVIGVVADTKQATLDAPIRQELYVASTQHPRLGSELKIVARTAGEPSALTESFRQLATRLNPEVPLKFTTAELLIAETLAAPRFRTLLIGLTAGVALALALIGVAGVMACVVAERRNEIGIRMALGAPPARVVWHFTSRGLRLVALGLGIGLLASLAGARLLQGFLYEVSPGDPLVFSAIVVLLALSALIACVVPALRAARVDPLIALRAE